AGAAGAMHQVSDRAPTVTSVEYGFDLDNIYVRVEGSERMASLLGRGVELNLNFLKPAGVRVAIRLDGAKAEVAVVQRDANGRWMPLECAGLPVGGREV